MDREVMEVSQSVFGPGFDMEAYLAKRSLEIRSLQDRSLFKDVADKLILELCRYSKEEYERLEDRIFGEFQSTQNDYAVYIGMIERELYDATDKFLAPIEPVDVLKQEVPLPELQAALDAGQLYPLYTIFLEAPYSEVRRFAAVEQQYRGIVKTDCGEYSAVFSVASNTRYLQKIEELYHIFGANYRAWTTVCDAYLYKMFDVSIVSMEVADPQACIQSVTVNFGQFADSVRYGMVPLWNLVPFVEKTSTYPEPCMDKTNYEHKIFAHRLNADCHYLVTNTGVEMTNIRRLNGDLIITCPEENPYKWVLYQVRRPLGPIKYAYPPLSNLISETFAGNLSDVYRRSVKTVSEVARLIESFQYSHYLTFHGVALRAHENIEPQTYDMDAFISDELRVGTAVQVMELSFSARTPDNFLNQDIMSFLVTQVQKLFPEYRCQGVLV